MKNIKKLSMHYSLANEVTNKKGFSGLKNN